MCERLVVEEEGHAGGRVLGTVYIRMLNYSLGEEFDWLLHGHSTLPHCRPFDPPPKQVVAFLRLDDSPP